MPKLSPRIDLRIIRPLDYPPYPSAPIRADDRGSTVYIKGFFGSLKTTKNVKILCDVTEDSRNAY